MNGDLTFSVNKQCWCIINDHIFRDVQAAPWPNFQLTTQPLNAIFWKKAWQKDKINPKNNNFQGSTGTQMPFPWQKCFF